MVALALLTTSLAPTGAAAVFQSEYIFESDPLRSSFHCPAIVQCANGDLLAAWHAVKGSYLEVVCARKPPAGSWSAPATLVSDPSHGVGNPVLWRDPGNTIWLFYTRQTNGDWETGQAQFQTSADHGATWSVAQNMVDALGYMFCNHPIVTGAGAWLVPMYYQPNWTSVMRVSTDQGSTWAFSSVIDNGGGQGNGVIQPTVIERSDNSLYCLMRKGPKPTVVYQSSSTDGGWTWAAPTATTIPHPNSLLEMVRLASGRIVLAYNHSDTDRTPLSVALSFDEGATWQARRDLESGSGSFSFPSVMQTSDGLIHVVYNWNSQRIKHVVFNEEWLIGSGPAGVIVANTDAWTSGEQKACEWLQDVLYERVGQFVPIVDDDAYLPLPGRIDFLAGRAGSHGLIDTMRPGLSLAAEGYHLETIEDGGVTYLLCAGADTRGTLYAVGRALRSMTYGPGSLAVPALNIETAPETPLRGHLLSHRQNSSSYYTWSLDQWESYLRDLIAYGVNLIGIIPGHYSMVGGDWDTDPWKSYWAKTKQLSQMIHDYGLLVGAWAPPTDLFPGDVDPAWVCPYGSFVDPTVPDAHAAILATRHRTFSELPYLDLIFLNSADPPGGGGCYAHGTWMETFLPICQDIADIVHTYHPNCDVYVTNQEVTPEEDLYLYDYITTTNPAWLAGVAFGPRSRDLAELRASIPPAYNVILYSDVNHSSRCQYPQREFDRAFAAIYQRDPPSYRPTDYQVIRDATIPNTVGDMCYDEGVHSDLNKVVWSALDWDSSQPLSAIVQDYCKYLLNTDDATAAEVASAVFDLEANWRENPLTSTEIAATRAALEGIATAEPDLLDNWRFQMMLLRAKLDHWIQLKAQRDHAIEQDAYAALLGGIATPGAALSDALASIDAAYAALVAPDLLDEIKALRDSLWGEVDLELPCVDRADDPENWPLASIAWLRVRITQAQGAPDDLTKRRYILSMTDYQRAGPYGFYDDAGSVWNRPHQVMANWPDDPGFNETTADFQHLYLWSQGLRLSLNDCAFAGYGKHESPVIFHYEGIAPAADLVARMPYVASRGMVSDQDVYADATLIDGPRTLPENAPNWQVVTIPPGTYADGVLDLTFVRHSFGRGAQVPEIWLYDQRPAIVINDGAATTDSPTLDLELWALDLRDDLTLPAPRQMQFQYPGSGGWTAWEPFAYAKQITVDAPDGTVQVDFRVKYSDLSASTTASDTIILDTNPCHPSLSSGYVQPDAGGISDDFTFRIKFWDLCDRIPNEVWVAVWSSATGTPRWRRMWEYDPADTTTTDGKWYTYTAHLDGGDHAYRFAARVTARWVYWPEPAGTYVTGLDVNPVVLSSGYVTPASGSHATRFTWRVKYWNTVGAAADQVWCAIWWGSRGQALWYPMWEYDPSDANCQDGKWYTLSMRWLDPSAHAFRFAARQGDRWAYWPQPAGSYAAGPTVSP